MGPHAKANDVDGEHEPYNPYPQTQADEDAENCHEFLAWSAFSFNEVPLARQQAPVFEGGSACGNCQHQHGERDYTQHHVNARLRKEERPIVLAHTCFPRQHDIQQSRQHPGDGAPNKPEPKPPWGYRLWCLGLNLLAHTTLRRFGITYKITTTKTQTVSTKCQYMAAL